MHEISVRPCASAVGWIVEQSTAHPTVFLSSEAAVASARGWVIRLGQAGVPARATTWLSDGSMAGQVTVF